MKLKSDGQTFTHTVQLLSGKPANEIKEMNENLGVFAVLSYVKKEKIIIPFIGEVVIHQYTAGTRYDFVPSPFLVQNIGQIEDGKETEVESIMTRKFKDVLKPRQKCQK